MVHRVLAYYFSKRVYYIPYILKKLTLIIGAAIVSFWLYHTFHQLFLQETLIKTISVFIYIFIYIDRRNWC